MRAHLEMCYMITKLTKKMLRIKRLIQDFSYVENLAKRRKYPVRFSVYMI
jgi:hypothetical protein